MHTSQKLLRIGVFYDGNYFLHVSNYYNYVNERKRRISIAGLHTFIRHQVSKLEDAELHLCHVVDAHYFRGRLNASEASQRPNQLYYERVFDDILMSEGVTTHYLPLRSKMGKKEEKGIDVWLAVEVLELAYAKKYDVVCLITADGDYVPLLRKLNTIGTRVMLLSWDFAYNDEGGRTIETRTSQDLLMEATYPVAMHELLENRLHRDNPHIANIFVPENVNNGKNKAPHYATTKFTEPDASTYQSQVQSIIREKGYGFIDWDPTNIFFHSSDLKGIEFSKLMEGDMVEFKIGKNGKGGEIAVEIRVLTDEEIGATQHSYAPEQEDEEYSESYNN